MSKPLICGIASCVVACLTGGASAQFQIPTGFDFRVVLNDSTNWQLSNDLGSISSIEKEGLTTLISGQASVAGTSWDYEFQILDSGRASMASVSSAFTITNNAAGVNNFSTTTSIAASVAGPTSIFGSVSGSVGDNPLFGNGATITALAGSSLYAAKIDGLTVATLLDDPYSQSAAAFGTNIIGPQSFGFTPGAPAVTSTIAITNEFSLTGNDNASLTSTFVVIPAPSGAALLSVMGLAATRRRR